MGSTLRKARRRAALADRDEHDDSKAIVHQVGPIVEAALKRGAQPVQVAYALLWLAHDVATAAGFGAGLIPTLTKMEEAVASKAKDPLDG
jgi:hypothetical protein